MNRESRKTKVGRLRLFLSLLVLLQILAWLFVGRGSLSRTIPTMLRRDYAAMVKHLEDNRIPVDIPGKPYTVVVCSDLATALGTQGLHDLQLVEAEYGGRVIVESQAPPDWCDEWHTSPGYVSLCQVDEWSTPIVARVTYVLWRSGTAAQSSSRLVFYLVGWWVVGPVVGSWVA